MEKPETIESLRELAHDLSMDLRLVKIQKGPGPDARLERAIAIIEARIEQMQERGDD